MKKPAPLYQYTSKGIWDLDHTHTHVVQLMHVDGNHIMI